MSDLLIAVIGIPMDFAAAYQFGWKMGEIPCVFLGFVLTFLGKKMCFSLMFSHPFLYFIFPSVCIVSSIRFRWDVRLKRFVYLILIHVPSGMFCVNILSCISFYRWLILNADVSIEYILTFEQLNLTCVRCASCPL